MDLKDFPPCKHRFGCVKCRNDETFRNYIENRFGKINCPEGIPINTPLDKMPKHIQDKIEEYYKEEIEKQKEETEKNNNNIEIMKEKILKDRSFVNSAQCKQRKVCVKCRNSDEFRYFLEHSFGKWECPEGIPINTPLDKMPKHIQDKANKKDLDKAQDKANVKDLDSLDNNKKPKSFIDHPLCKSRSLCFQCRNNDGFRTSYENRFGKWECPEGIPINTPLDKMPKHIQNKIKNHIEHVKNVKETNINKNISKTESNNIKKNLDSIEELLPSSALPLLDGVRYFIFPHEKNGDLCKYNKESIKVQKICCGGKVNEVDGYSCEKHGEILKNFCIKCQDFERKDRDV